jgi:hypothetical protein
MNFFLFIINPNKNSNLTKHINSYEYIMPQILKSERERERERIYYNNNKR